MAKLAAVEPSMPGNNILIFAIIGHIVVSMGL
jgi:hypothetical protein